MTDVFEAKTCIVTGGTSGIGLCRPRQALLKARGGSLPRGVPEESIEAAREQLSLSTTTPASP